MEGKSRFIEKIEQEAIEQGVDPNVAIKVAMCESGIRQGVKAKTSSASGIFQFLASTWKSTLARMGLPPNLDVFDGATNIMVGLWLMAQDGIHTHWYPSQHCWDTAPLALN